jgi:hypothetical protein
VSPADPNQLSSLNQLVYAVGQGGLIVFAFYVGSFLVQGVMVIHMCYKVGKEKLLSEAEHDPD